MPIVGPHNRGGTCINDYGGQFEIPTGSQVLGPGMSKKRTKAGRAQRQADQLEKKASRRPAQNRKEKASREDFSQANLRIVRKTTEDMKSILSQIVDELERLAISLDALELALISKGNLQHGEVVANSALPEPIVRQRLSGLRAAIASLSAEAAEPSVTAKESLQ